MTEFRGNSGLKYRKKIGEKPMYRLAKARVAGSNPVSCSLKYLEKPESKGFSFFVFPLFSSDLW